jgi:flavodoxin I
MKTLVVYDSLYGNTRTIAQTIGETIPGEVELLHVGEAKAAGLEAYEQIQARALEGVNVAGFDTRLTNRLITLFGTAAPKIAKALQKKGGTLAGPPGGFYVTGGEGPLKDGEIERANAWAQELVGSQA